MKFTIKNEQEVEKEPIIELSLEENGDEICLMGYAKTNGEIDKRYIMGFRENGKFYRSSSVDLKGLKLDDTERIIEEEE